MELEFTNLLVVVAAGFAAPLLLGFAPRLRLPSVVLELVAGIVLGPAVLGWVEVDAPVQVLSVVGLAILLFLAGLEIEFDRLRGATLRVTLAGFVLSFVVAIGVGLVLQALGLVSQPVFVAVLLSATSLGVLVPVLKDSGHIASTFGQLVIAAGSIADFGAVILLSLLFSREATSTSTKVILLAGLFVIALLIGLTVAGVEHSRRVRDTLVRLQDTTAQIRVRGAVVLLMGFVALAATLGLEVILGAFLAGAVLTLIDRDRAMTHPQFRLKLEAVGFGVFIPVFFVTSGVNYDLDALTSNGSTLAKVPVFLAALVVTRGIPALLYRRLIGLDRVVIAGLMQATSLPFIVAGTAIGQDLGLISAGSSAALIAAGLLSVLIFPALSLSLLKRGRRPRRLVETPAHEGPVVIDGDLYFTTLPDVAGRTSIRRLCLADGTLSTVVADANAANGMARDAEGRLIVCEQGTLETPAAITRIDPRSGAREVLTDGCDGRPFNSPNDVCVRSDGTIWFTDPSYGFVQGFRPPPADGDHVYRFDPATGVTERVASGFDKPNGLAFSPDERTLYVGDNGAGELHAIDLDTGERRLLASFEGEHPDGLKVAPDGRLHASSVAGIELLEPDGARAGRIDVPGAVNLWIEGDRVYITADTAVWAAERSET